MYTLFGAFGALACTFLGDRIGRRKTIFAATIVQAVGAVIQCSASAFAQFVVGRIFLGLGTGGLIATISVWQSEVSRAESRGEHVSAFGIFCGTGHAIALWLAFGMSHTQPSPISWRLVLALTTLFSIVVCCFIFTLPESPRWLCKADRWEEAREILALLYDEDLRSDRINQEISDIHVSLELSDRSGSALRSLFTMDRQRIFHRLVLAAGLQMFLQMNGINSVVYVSISCPLLCS